jgi:hypothetical protein
MDDDWVMCGDPLPPTLDDLIDLMGGQEEVQRMVEQRIAAAAAATVETRERIRGLFWSAD